MEAELHRAGKKRKLQGIQQRLAHAEASTTANSAVHALLMTLLAKGIMSGVLAHEFARAAQEDLRRAREGIVYPDLEKLANLAQGRNLLRSVFAQLRKSTSLPEPTKIPMPYTDGWQDTASGRPAIGGGCHTTKLQRKVNVEEHLWHVAFGPFCSNCVET
ncbi:unnamed protein product [Cladocopium goreaui]|uniref:Uncharacterized protein n=1 Tax=Cladocopium goreaui TaxID=2562237 RepID=A0A9P1GAX4_9DINO|nr:unnamed protein product [Cladocopium goreaui]